MTALFISAATGYFLGSIPFGFILVRAFRGEDIRRLGSGNIGATNVSRSSPLLGVLTLAFDALKGAVAVLLIRQIFPGTPMLPAFAGLFAIIGHVFPVWLGFRGGKGVATGMGSFVILAPKTLLLAAAVFAAILLLFRYVSLSSLIAVALFPLFAFWKDRFLGPTVIALMAAGSLLILLKHASNIRRLIAGTEPRFHWTRG